MCVCVCVDRPTVFQVSFINTKCVHMLSHVQFFATPSTVAHQIPLSMELPRQKYWSGLLFPSPGDLLGPKTESESPTLAGAFFTIELPGKPLNTKAVVNCAFR